MVSKYRCSARRNSTSGRLASITGRPCMSIVVVTEVLPSGSRVVPPTDSTPGNRSMRWKKSLIEGAPLLSRA